MEPLRSKHRSHLRKKAHGLKPLLHVGKDGVTAATHAALAEAFRTRELLKVKVLDGAPGSPREHADEITAALENVQTVQVMGRTVTLYRPADEKPPETARRKVPPSRR